MIKIVCIGVITSILILLLNEQQKGIAAVLLLAGSIAIFLLCTDYLKEILSLIDTISSRINIDKIYLKILLKILGIAYVCQFFSDICRDLGSQTLGKQIESAGKLAVLIVGIPVIQGLFDTLRELLTI